MKSIKIVLAISAILGVALLNSASAGAAKYITEDVENNPDYRFLRQRLVKMEIDEDEEIDWEEFYKNIFVPSRTKCSLAKAFPGVSTYKQLYRDYDYVNQLYANLSKKDIPNLPNYNHDNHESNTLWVPEDSFPKLEKYIEEVKNNKSISSENIKAALEITFGIYDYSALEDKELEITNPFIRDHHEKLTVSYQDIENAPTKKYVDMEGLLISRRAPLMSCSGRHTVLIFEEFDLVINRKPTQDQATETTQQETITETSTITAPNTGFNPTNPIALLAGLTTLSTGLFLLKRK